MDWEDVYLSVVKEVDGEKMPKGIADARRAIQERLTGLQNGDQGERERLEQALRSLAVLETESRNWSSS